MIKKILLVDDSMTARLTTKHQLVNHFESVDVIEAKDGESSIEIIKQLDDIDLVLMDVNMPGMGGIKASEEILKIKPEIKILIVTANFQKSIKESADNMGAILMEKPFSMQKLEQILEE